MKNYLIQLSNAPFDDFSAEEALELVQAMGALDQKVSLWFTSKGIQQLLELPTEANRTNFLKAIPSLHYYGIEEIFVDKESLDKYPINPDEFSVTVNILSLAVLNRKKSDFEVFLPL